jgi:hypothetical protein
MLIFSQKPKNELFVLLVIVLDLALLYYAFFINYYQLFAIVAFVAYFLVVGRWWQFILQRFFGISRQVFLFKAYSYFIVFVLLAFFASAWIALYYISLQIIFGCYAAVAVLTYFIFVFSKSIRHKKELSDIKLAPIFKERSILLVFYIIFSAIALYLLLNGNRIEPVFSPWQAISKYYIVAYFASLFLLGIIVLSRFKSKTILFFLIIHSALLHLYIPISNNLPAGGDVWRLIGAEQRLSEERTIPPVIAGPEYKSRQYFGINIPEVFLIPHKYAYGQLWGASVLVSRTLDINLEALNIWLIPILWSIVFPLIMFRIGFILFESRRAGIFFSFLSFVPFAFQALGSLSLPVSFGYLVFFLALMFWLQYLKEGYRRQALFGIALLFVMLFGYTLHFIIFAFIIFVSLFLKTINRQYCYYIIIKKFCWNRILTPVIIFASMFVFPVIEYASRISSVPASFDLTKQIKQAVGVFFGYFFASAIRPHDILIGNIIFNHTPSHAFVENFFLNFRWHFIPFMLIVFILVFYGFFRIIKNNEDNLALKVIAAVFSFSFGGYIIGWFVLEGDRLFTRRMDAMIAFLILFFGMHGFLCLKKYWSRFATPASAVLLIFIISFVGAATYASGPDIAYVSNAQHKTAKYVWNNIDKNEKNFCVLADTYTLLALEGISGQKIVGGGFPIDYNFGQQKRVELLNKLASAPEKNILKEIKLAVNSKKCWIILNNNNLNDNTKEKIDKIFGTETAKISQFSIWYINLQ